MRSLKKYINQFKEEIARYECHRGMQPRDETRLAVLQGIHSDAELDNTLRKLRRLEELLESKSESVGDNELRRAERISIKRIIKQLKEEIARYKAHQPAR
jgi:hypothetical protein